MMADKQKFIIAAVDLAGGFAKDKKIPWSYKEDFKFFQEQTKGHVCVMGRGTYNDLVDIFKARGKYDPTKPILPDRDSFVVTSKPEEVVGAIGISNWWDIDLRLPEDDTKKIFFIGGSRIFSETIPIVHGIFLTVINKEFGCDQFFPRKYLLKHFSAQQCTHYPNGEVVVGNNDLSFTFWTPHTTR